MGAAHVDNGRGAGDEPDAGAVLLAIDPITPDEGDEISLRDLDIEANPLPRVPRALWALWALRLAVVAMAGAVVGGAYWLGGTRVAVVVGLWPGLSLLAIVLAAVGVRLGQGEEGLLRLEREAHPRFFELVDEICARVSAPPPEAFFLINESNSYNARVRRHSSILLGFPAIIAYDVTALRSTLGHELGHHLAGDTRDGALLAWAEVETLGRIPALLFPLRGLARRLADLAKADSMRRSRLNEHAADFWGGVAAGQGTTAACLQMDRRAAHLWQTLVDDMTVLREGGYRVDDVYRILQLVRQAADHDGFEMLPSAQRTDPLSTHPAEGARTDIAEAQLRHLAPVVIDESPAVDLFEARDAIMADLTALYFDPRGHGDDHWLEVVDTVDLWDRYIEALRPQLRGAFAAVGHPRLGEPMSSLALFHEVRFLVEAGVRFLAPRRDETLGGLVSPPDTIASGMEDVQEVDVTHRLVGALLDLLVHDGVVGGSRDWGSVRSVTVDAVEYFRLVLAARLGRGEMWDGLNDEIERRQRWLHKNVATATAAAAWLEAFHRRPAVPDIADDAFDEDTDGGIVNPFDERTDEVPLNEQGA